VIWNEKFAAKITEKHGVSTDEVEEVLFFAAARSQVGKRESAR
jgi:uncharacterized DUF497 family protein